MEIIIRLDTITMLVKISFSCLWFNMLVGFWIRATQIINTNKASLISKWIVVAEQHISYRDVGVGAVIFLGVIYTMAGFIILRYFITTLKPGFDGIRAIPVINTDKYYPCKINNVRFYLR